MIRTRSLWVELVPEVPEWSDRVYDVRLGKVYRRRPKYDGRQIVRIDVEVDDAVIRPVVTARVGGAS